MPEREPAGPDRREVLQRLVAVPFMGNIPSMPGNTPSVEQETWEKILPLVAGMFRKFAQLHPHQVPEFLNILRDEWIDSARSGDISGKESMERIIRESGLADLPDQVTWETWNDIRCNARMKIKMETERRETRLLIAQMMQSVIAHKEREENIHPVSR